MALSFGCSDTDERLPLLHYGDSEDAEERRAVEPHVASSASCANAHWRVRATARLLDSADRAEGGVPAPSDHDWARFQSRLEAKVAPIRMARLARKGLFRPTFLRVAASLVIAGLGATCAYLYFQHQDLKTQVERGPLVHVFGPDKRPIPLRIAFKWETGKLAEICAREPLSELAEPALAAILKKRDDPAFPIPSLDDLDRKPLELVRSSGEVERLRRFAAEPSADRVEDGARLYALSRAGQMAEELKDRPKALASYREMISRAPADFPLKEPAEQRLAAMLETGPQ